MDAFAVLDEYMTDRVVECGAEVHSVLGSDGDIVIGLRTGRILVFDSENDEIRELVGHKEAVSALGLSQEKGVLISGSQDKNVIIWDFDELSEVFRISQFKGGLTGISVTNGMFFTSSIDCTVKCFSIENYDELNEKVLECPLTAITNTEELVILGTDEGLVLFLDFSLELLRTVQAHNDSIWSLSSWQYVLVTGSYDGTLCVWNTQDFSYKLLGEHYGVVNSVLIADISQAGIPVIISGGSDNLIKIWSLLGLQDIFEFHREAVYALAVDSLHLITGGFDKLVRSWSWVTAMKVKKIVISHDLLMAGALDSRGCAYYSSGRTLVVKEGDQHREIEGFEGIITSIFVGELAGVLVVGNRDRTVKVLDIVSFSVLAEYRHEAAVKSACFIGNKVVSGSHDGQVLVFSLSEKARLGGTQLEGAITGLTANEELIICTTKNKIFCLSWDFCILNEKAIEEGVSTVIDKEYLFLSTPTKLHVLSLESLATLYTQSTPTTYSHLSILKSAELFCISGHYILSIPNYIKEIRK